MQQISFEEVVEQIVVKDKRYQREAYQFVREALEHTRRLVDREHKEQPKTEKRVVKEEQHVSGQQLLAGVRDLALESFGPMAMTVLEEWGIRTCPDVGEIVFTMVEHKLLKKTDRDSRKDFENGFDFFETFRKPFLPQSKLADATVQPKEAQA
jgi:uncharacterized repeat protein (TIGR04138 family)